MGLGNAEGVGSEGDISVAFERTVVGECRSVGEANALVVGNAGVTMVVVEAPFVCGVVGVETGDWS
jgi:hypothetical protein